MLGARSAESNAEAGASRTSQQGPGVWNRHEFGSPHAGEAKITSRSVIVGSVIGTACPAYSLIDLNLHRTANGDSSLSELKAPGLIVRLWDAHGHQKAFTIEHQFFSKVREAVESYLKAHPGAS